MMQAWMVEEGATGKVKKGPRVSTKLPSNLQATSYEEYVAICRTEKLHNACRYVTQIIWFIWSNIENEV